MTSAAIRAKGTRAIVNTSFNPLNPFDWGAAVGTIPSRVHCARYSKYVVEAAEANVERWKIGNERQKQYAAAKVAEANLKAESKIIRADMKKSISGRMALMREELSSL